MYKYDYQQVLQFLNKNSAKQRDLDKEVKRKQKENDDLMERQSRVDVNMNELNLEIEQFEKEVGELPDQIKKTVNYLLVTAQEKRQLELDIEKLEKPIFNNQPRQPSPVE